MSCANFARTTGCVILGDNSQAGYMEEKQAHNPLHGVRTVYLALYFLGALVSGVGGNFLWLRSTGPEVVAPDRFTGTQAASLIRRVDHIESAIDRHVERHPETMNRFDARLSALEAQYQLILQNQSRILDRLDSM